MGLCPAGEAVLNSYGRFEHRMLRLAVGAILLFTALREAPTLSGRYLHDDYRQNLFWLPKLTDPSLYPDDPNAAYARSFSTTGVEWLYLAGMKLGLSGPAEAVLLSVAVFALFVWAVNRLGRSLHPVGGATAAPVLVLFVLLHNHYFLRMSAGGIARTFAFPMHALLLWMLVRRRHWTAMALSLVGAFLHPQTFLLGFGSLIIIAVARLVRRRGRDRHAWLLVGVLLLAGLPAMGMLHYQAELRTESYGRMITKSEILASEDYKEGGRWYMERPISFPLTICQEFASYLPQGKRFSAKKFLLIAMVLFWTVSFVGTLVWMARRKQVLLLRLAPLGTALAASLILYFAASAVLPRAYFPNRYLRPVLPLVVLSVLALAASRSLTARGPARVWGWVVILSFLPLFDTKPVMDFRYDTERFRGAAAAIDAGTPKDAGVLAWPAADADTLSAMVRRPVYIERELSHPLYTGFMKLIAARTERGLAGFLPTGRSDFEALLRDGVRVVVINRNRLEDWNASTPSYSRPWDRWLTERCARVEGGMAAFHRFWDEVPASAVLYEDSECRVIVLEELARNPPDFPRGT